MRKQPISPVTDPLQFRAIGLVRGIYKPEDPDCISRGVIHAMDETQLEAVLLGRVIHLVQRYVDLNQPHLWVCYPRNRDKTRSKLHLQVMGIWEPKLLNPADESPQQVQAPKAPKAPEAPDGYFSIRGELIFTDPGAQKFLIKIRQQPQDSSKRPRSFKLMLHGIVPRRVLHHFLSVDLKRRGQSLHTEHYDVIQPMNRGRPGRGPGGRKRVNQDRSSVSRPSRLGFSI